MVYADASNGVKKIMDNMKVFLIQYPERIAFGVALLVFLVILVTAEVISPAEDPAISGIDTKAKQVETLLKKNQPRPFPELNQYHRLADRVNNVVEVPQPIGNWLMYRKPIYRIKVFTPAAIPPKKNLPPILKPLLVKPEQPDRVFLTWQKNEQSTARLKGYRIYRKTASDKNFTPLVALTTDLITPTSLMLIYEDKSIQPKTDYLYYVTAFTDESNVIEPESKPSKEEKITTPEIVKITVTKSVIPTKAYIRIEKYINGTWWPHVTPIQVGEKIGGITKRAEGEFDFSTGYILKDIQEIEITKKVSPTEIHVGKGWKIIYLDEKTGKVKERQGEKDQEIPLVP